MGIQGYITMNKNIKNQGMSGIQMVYTTSGVKLLVRLENDLHLLRVDVAIISETEGEKFDSKVEGKLKRIRIKELENGLLQYDMGPVGNGKYKISVKLKDEWIDILHGLVIKAGDKPGTKQCTIEGKLFDEDSTSKESKLSEEGSEAEDHKDDEEKHETNRTDMDNPDDGG